MRSASFALLASLLAVAQAAQESELPDAAFAADDACAAGEGGEACEVSLRQLRGQKVATAADEEETELEEGKHGAVYLTSFFSEGEDDATDSRCYSKSMTKSSKKLYSAYSETDEGAKWDSTSAVLSVEGQSKKFDDVDPAGLVGLRMRLSYEPNDQKTVIRVGNLKEAIPHKLSVHSAECQRSYCKLAKPECGDESCSPESPMCGWVKHNASMDAPLSKTVSFNVTGIVNENRSSLQVFAVPVGLDEDGFWDTPKISIESWRFFTYAGDGSADEEFPWDF